MSRVPTSLRRLLPFCFGTNASNSGGISDDQGDTQELIPVTDADGSSAGDSDSGSGSEDESPAAPLLPPSNYTLPGAMEKQLPASLSRQHSVNALMRARELSNSSPPPQEDPREDLRRRRGWRGNASPASGRPRCRASLDKEGQKMELEDADAGGGSMDCLHFHICLLLYDCTVLPS